MTSKTKIIKALSEIAGDLALQLHRKDEKVEELKDEIASLKTQLSRNDQVVVKAAEPIKKDELVVLNLQSPDDIALIISDKSKDEIYRETKHNLVSALSVAMHERTLYDLEDEKHRKPFVDMIGYLERAIVTTTALYAYGSEDPEMYVGDVAEKDDPIEFEDGHTAKIPIQVLNQARSALIDNTPEEIYTIIVQHLDGIQKRANALNDERNSKAKRNKIWYVHRAMVKSIRVLATAILLEERRLGKQVDGAGVDNKTLRDAIDSYHGKVTAFLDAILKHFSDDVSGGIDLISGLRSQYNDLKDEMDRLQEAGLVLTKRY